MNDLSDLSNIERQESLLRLVEKEQRLSVSQICEEFSVSPATARRDLEVLTKNGKVRRIHGGALALKSAPPEPPIALRSAEQVEEKKRIGRAGATLIKDGDTVFLGSGTTVLEVANNLRSRRGLTVITHSLSVMNVLAGAPDITLVNLGGILRSNALSFIGHLTEQALADIRVEKIIFGIRAIDTEAGLTIDHLPAAQTLRAVLNIGKELILVADHTKCERASMAFVAPITVIDTFITDTKAPNTFISALTDQGIQVLTV